jgi:hypothetical protein
LASSKDLDGSPAPLAVLLVLPASSSLHTLYSSSDNMLGQGKRDELRQGKVMDKWICNRNTKEDLKIEEVWRD